MTVRLLRLVAAFCLAVLVTPELCSAIHSVEPPEAMPEYTKGKRLLRDGDFWGAARVFEGLAGRYSDSPDYDTFVFHRAKAKYYLGAFNEAIAGFSFFLSRFPETPQVAHVRFFLANSYYRTGDIVKALDQYLEAYRVSGDDRLDELLLRSIEALFEHANTIRISRTKFDQLPGNKRCLLIKRLSPTFVERNEISLAKELMASCDEKPDLTDRPKPPRQPENATIEIAVVLPLSGELRSYGEEINNGVVIAAEMFRVETNRQVKLVPFDTKGDPIDAARILGELEESSITAAIGPLTSEEAAVACSRLYNSDFPLIVPAATQGGLTRLGQSSFQLSPNIDLEGVRMAEYAVFVLNADSAAVITSTADVDLRLSNAFVERFQKLGGTVIAIEYCHIRDKDFGPNIRDIKGLLLGAVKDSTFYIDHRGDTLDIDGLPAHIDCLFFPGSRNLIRLLLPQINFYNLTGAYLGSDGWGEETIYRLGDDITKGAVFPSPFFSSSKTDQYARFATAFDARYGKVPGRLAGLGFDAFTLLSLALSSGAKTPQEVINQLKLIGGFGGVSGTITFGAFRENTEMPLYRIWDGEANPLEQVEATVEENTDQ